MFPFVYKNIQQCGCGQTILLYLHIECCLLLRNSCQIIHLKCPPVKMCHKPLWALLVKAAALPSFTLNPACHPSKRLFQLIFHPKHLTLIRKPNKREKRQISGWIERHQEFWSFQMKHIATSQISSHLVHDAGFHVLLWNVLQHWNAVSCIN